MEETHAAKLEELHRTHALTEHEHAMELSTLTSDHEGAMASIKEEHTTILLKYDEAFTESARSHAEDVAAMAVAHQEGLDEARQTTSRRLRTTSAASDNKCRLL